jgi:hypothetical protein
MPEIYIKVDNCKDCPVYKETRGDRTIKKLKSEKDSLYDVILERDKYIKDLQKEINRLNDELDLFLDNGERINISKERLIKILTNPDKVWNFIYDGKTLYTITGRVDSIGDFHMNVMREKANRDKKEK